MDETGFASSTHCIHGRALKGQKVYGLQSALSRPRSSLIGAYPDNKLIAPMLFEGACNSDLFHDWVEQAGCELLFLPPYSPDLNPIEKLWGNLKKLRQRTRAGVDELVGMSDYCWD